MDRTKQVPAMFTFFAVYFFAQQRLSPEAHSRINIIRYIDE